MSPFRLKGLSILKGTLGGDMVSTLSKSRLVSVQWGVLRPLKLSATTVANDNNFVPALQAAA